MDLLTSLGVNASLFVQLGLFVVVYLVLRHVLFAPYVEAFNQRRERTVGQADLAERFVGEARALEERYKAQAQKASEEYRAIYEKSRAESIREYDRVVNEARTRARDVVDRQRATIANQVQAAQAELKSEVGNISRLINGKLIGKDVQA